MNYSDYRRIWEAVRAIPYGRVATYGQIARLAGFPRGARRVGHALARIPEELAVPWHRVINAKGMLSLPPDSEAYRLQRTRLLEEGVLFNGQKIDLQRFGWRPTLDELLWKPPA